jgi:hypothetical protein
MGAEMVPEKRNAGERHQPHQQISLDVTSEHTSSKGEFVE